MRSGSRLGGVGIHREGRHPLVAKIAKGPGACFMFPLFVHSPRKSQPIASRSLGQTDPTLIHSKKILSKKQQGSRWLAWIGRDRECIHVQVLPGQNSRGSHQSVDFTNIHGSCSGVCSNGDPGIVPIQNTRNYAIFWNTQWKTGERLVSKIRSVICIPLRLSGDKTDGCHREELSAFSYHALVIPSQRR